MSASGVTVPEESSTTGAQRQKRATSEVAARTWPSLIAALSAAAIVTWLAFRSGGYFPTAFLPAGALAWAICAVVLILRPPTYPVSTHALLGLGALAGLAAWTGLSSAWSLNAGAGLEDMQRDLVYVALFGLGLLAAGSGRLAGVVVRVLGATAAVVVVAGLVHRVAPDAAETVAPIAYRLDYPLSYWNAYGALAALTAVLGVGLAADDRGNIVQRAVAAGAALLAVVGMYLSLSRGAWLALGVGIVVLIAVRPRRTAVLTSLAIVGGLAAIALLRLRGYPGLVEDPAAGSGQVDEGRAFIPWLVVLALAASIAQALVAVAARRWQPALVRARRLAPYAAGLALVVALVGYAASAGSVDRATNRAGDYVDRQWEDFLRPTTAAPGVGSARLTSSEGTRSEVYRVALDGFGDHPVAGDGAGSFRVRWARDREVAHDLRNAHSLYLETLSDTGLVGLALLGAFLGSLAVAAARSLSRPRGLTTGEAAAVTAACAVWAAHSAIDWDWQMPALTGLVLVLAATLYPYGRRTRQRRSKEQPA